VYSIIGSPSPIVSDASRPYKKIKQKSVIVYYFTLMFDNIELCIDATTYGNISRFIRRSCKSNAEVSYRVDN
jgi:SET domain-containing protein